VGPDAHPVFDLERFVPEDGDASDDVLERILGGQGEGQPADAKAGEDRKYVVAQVGENDDAGEDGDNGLGRLADDGQDLVVELALGLLRQWLEVVLDAHVDEAQDEPGHGQGDDDERALAEDLLQPWRQGEEVFAEVEAAGYQGESDRLLGGGEQVVVELSFALRGNPLQLVFEEVVDEAADDEAPGHGAEESQVLPQRVAEVALL